MEKTIIATGKTIDLAIESALTQLGLGRVLLHEDKVGRITRKYLLAARTKSAGQGKVGIALFLAGQRRRHLARHRMPAASADALQDICV